MLLFFSFLSTFLPREEVLYTFCVKVFESVNKFERLWPSWLKNLAFRRVGQSNFYEKKSNKEIQKLKKKNSEKVKCEKRGPGPSGISLSCERRKRRADLMFGDLVHF